MSDKDTIVLGSGLMMERAKVSPDTLQAALCVGNDRSYNLLSLAVAPEMRMMEIPYWCEQA